MASVLHSLAQQSVRGRRGATLLPALLLRKTSGQRRTCGRCRRHAHGLAGADLEFVTVEEPSPGVLCLTIDRPDVYNAFSTKVAIELKHCFEALAEGGSGCRAVVLTGAGKGFCAGADLKERQGLVRAPPLLSPSVAFWHACRYGCTLLSCE